MTDRNDWEGRTGRKWADEWRRTDRSFAGLTDHLLRHARSEPYANVLDIGCGAGELSLALARENARAKVIGIDVSTDLVAAALPRGEMLLNASFQVDDAATWRPEAGREPDLLVSRHGVMFFDDPVGAFAHLRGIARPAARLVFSCFHDRRANAWASGITDLLPAGSVSIPEPGAPGPFAFADRHHVEAILAAAGWDDIAFDAVDFAYVAGSGGDPVDDALTYFLAIGPAAAAAAELDRNDRMAFIERLEQFLLRHRDGSIVALPAAAWIVTARRS